MIVELQLINVEEMTKLAIQHLATTIVKDCFKQELSMDDQTCEQNIIRNKCYNFKISFSQMFLNYKNSNFRAIHLSN